MGHYLRSQGHGSQRHLGCGSRCGIPRLFPQRRHRSHDTASRRRDGSQHRTETAQPCFAEFRRHPDRPTQRAHLSPARFRDGPLVRGTALNLFPHQRTQHDRPSPSRLRSLHQYVAGGKKRQRGDATPASRLPAGHLRDAHLRRIGIRFGRIAQNLSPHASLRSDPDAVRLPRQPGFQLPAHHRRHARSQYPRGSRLLQPPESGHPHLHAGRYHRVAGHYHRLFDHHGRPLQLLSQPARLRLDPRGAAHHDRSIGDRLVAPRKTTGQPDRFLAGNRHQPRRFADRGAALHTGAARQVPAQTQHDGLLGQTAQTDRPRLAGLRPVYRLGPAPPLVVHRGLDLGIRHPHVPVAGKDRTRKGERRPAEVRNSTTRSWKDVS